MKRALVLIAIVACNKPSTDAPPTSSAATSATAAPANKVKVTLDGKESPASHAMIQKVASGSLQLYVGDGSSCKEFQGHLFNGGKFILVDLGPVANGVAPVTDVWHGPPDSADPGSTVTIHGDVATASKVDVDLSITSKEAKLDAKGTVSADVCK